MITVSGTREEIYNFIDDYTNCPFPEECPNELGCTECVLEYCTKFKFVIE